ncbi:MAG: hypothetical protein ACRCSG_09450 [Cellulosilyticaceae bacterium]
MIKQSKDYVKTMKKKYLLKSVLWGSIVCIIFLVGIVLMKKRASEFTLVAALFILPFSLYLTRYFAFFKYKDPNIKNSEMFEKMKGTYGLYHSAIFPESETLYIDHVVVTARTIYFVSESEETLTKAKQIFPVRFKGKGMDEGQLKYIYAKDKTSIKNASLKIQKDACYTDENLTRYNKIIEAMLM